MIHWDVDSNYLNGKKISLPKVQELLGKPHSYKYVSFSLFTYYKI